MTPVDISRKLSRRSILRRGGLMAGTAALIGGNQLLGGRSSAMAASAGTSLRLEVAVDGGTNRFNRRAGADPEAPPVAGDSFLIKGRIFPDGTSAAGLSGPHQEGSIGSWICYGTLLFDVESGLTPFFVATQFFVLDTGDGLITEGTEGGTYTLRTIAGGYGAYRGASGQCHERGTGANDTTIVLSSELTHQAPNLAFHFQFS